MANSPKETPADRPYRIVEKGLCIGCGMCEAAVGRDRIEVCCTTTDDLRPMASEALS